MAKKIILSKKVKKTHINKSIFKKPFLNPFNNPLRNQILYILKINPSVIINSKKKNINHRMNIKSLLRVEIQVKSNKKSNLCMYLMHLNHLHINHLKKPTNLYNGPKLTYLCSVKVTKLIIIKVTLIYWIKLIKKIACNNNRHVILNINQIFQLTKSTWKKEIIMIKYFSKK